MKKYGPNKSTEFTKKQINVIYSKAKAGDLKVEKWVMSEIYDLADYYGYDYNASVEFIERFVLIILEAVFANELEKAQEDINALTDIIYSRTTKKLQDKIDRSVFVA